MKLILILFTCVTIISSPNSDDSGTCTGSANCTACSTCEYCKYCNGGGGSCGVCSMGSKNHGYDVFPTHKKSNNSPSSIPKTNISPNSIFSVSATTLNLRTGAGTNYSIISELHYGDLVKVIETSGNWRKVIVLTTLETGYVHGTYIK